MSKELVVITGASSGIGKATAKMFSELGHPLLLLGRRVELLEALDLPSAMVQQLDVRDIDAFKSAISAAEEKFGPVGCLVNNAGVMLLGDVSTQDQNEWQTMMDVNMMGVLNGIQAVLSGMTARNNGTIINISSVAGIKPFASHAAYCATKYGVYGLTETIREEVADKNVRVIVVSPGAVETELLSHTTSSEIKEGYEAWKKDIGGVLESDDIARAVIYAYQQPQNVCVREIVLASTKQVP